jgi:CubicO group peptidase (beta-lactamase class C family)
VPDRDRTRALPRRPNLRFLKIEAKRRLSAGEFATLHDAQLAVAREHGLSSWTALKRLIDGTRPESRVLPHLTWIITRFAEAGQPGWTAPDDRELRRHFADRMLERVPPDQLVATVAAMAPRLRRRLVVTGAAPLVVRAELDGVQIIATGEAEPPHRLASVQRLPLGRRISDARVAKPSSRTSGAVPAAVSEIADTAFAELGLAGLVLAGGASDGSSWTVARGWADLERGADLQAGHRFPAYGISQLVAAVTVLRVLDEHRIGLDDPADEYLRTVRLSDHDVTIRQLLTHSGGVAHRAEELADSVPELLALTGPLLTCTGERGVFRYSNEGYGALGQLVADVTGSSFAAVATRLVLEPLAMTGSSFPARWPADQHDAVTGYSATGEGRFVPVPPRICTMPPAGGLWAPAADLVRLGLHWASLLPAQTAREALTPQAVTAPGDGPDPRHIGLGWRTDPAHAVAAMTGGAFGATTSLLVRTDGGRTHAFVALTNRRLPIHPVNERVLRACTPVPR